MQLSMTMTNPELRGHILFYLRQHLQRVREGDKSHSKDKYEFQIWNKIISIGCMWDLGRKECRSGYDSVRDETRVDHGMIMVKMVWIL